MTVDDIRKAIIRRHGRGDIGGWMEWVVLFEMGMHTGFEGGAIGKGMTERRIDAMVFNCHPTKGLKRIAYEVKMTKYDFEKELAVPQKRFLAMLYSTEFYFVAPAGVLSHRYFPAGCGLLTLSKPDDALRIEIDAKKRQLHPVSAGFLASAVRRAYQSGYKQCEKEKL